MPELHESSGLLSLASLREHEKAQAREQAEAARARAEAEQSARLEREAARRERERLSAERAAREVAESAQRTEQLRSEITQRAEAERAAALLRSSEELQLTLNREREARRIAELDLTARLLRQRLLTSVASAMSLVIGVGAFAFYFGALRPAAEHTLAAARQALLAEQRAHGEAEANARRSTRRSEELVLHVDSLEQRLREAQAAGLVAAPPPLVSHKPSGRPTTVNALRGPCSENGDPLDPCLRH